LFYSLGNGYFATWAAFLSAQVFLFASVEQLRHWFGIPNDFPEVDKPNDANNATKLAGQQPEKLEGGRDEARLLGGIDSAQDHHAAAGGANEATNFQEM
jgi:hypothetical protein